MARGKTAETISSNGFGESRTFNDPNAEPVITAAGVPLEDCHFNGKRIGDLGLTAEQMAIIAFRNTDEGIEMHRQELETQGRLSDGPRIEFGRDETTGANRIMQRRADLEAEMGEAATDPLKELADEYVAPGMRPKFLSTRKVDKESSTRGYEVVHDKQGNPVRFGTMILGQIPEERAIARTRRYADRSNQQIDEIKGRYQENQSRLRRGETPMTPLTDGSPEVAPMRRATVIF